MADLDINQAADAILAGLSATAASEPTVLRRTINAGARPYGVTADPNRLSSWTKTRQLTSTLSEYNAEFWERWEDPAFQLWLSSRLVAAGKYKGAPTAEQAYVSWVNLGEQTAGAAGWKGTPEQLLEFFATGTQKTAEQIAEDMKSGTLALDANGRPVDPNAAAEAANPIRTSVSTSYSTINPLAANAAVDKLSQALLGRMATKGEMARYRKAMNRILRSSPSVTETTVDSTDPDNVLSTSTTTEGASAEDAQDAVRMGLQRSSEGMAFNAGQMIEEALRRM